jgi:hypothetical protein
MQGEIKEIEQLRVVPMTTIAGPVALEQLATIEVTPVDERKRGAGGYGVTGNVLVSLVVNKQIGENIFTSSASAKEVIEQELATL